MEFNEILRTLRTEKDISQKVVAKYLGVDQKTISHYETGERQPDIQTLMKLAKFYRVSVDYLIGFNLHEDNKKQA